MSETEGQGAPGWQDLSKDVASLKAQNEKLVGELRKARDDAKAAKEAGTKLAELEPIKAKYEKLAAIAKELGVDPDKADPEKERQKIADAQRQREEESSRRERAITRALVGALPAGTSELLVEFALDRLMKDKTIVYNVESGAFEGLAEARKALLSDSLFGGPDPSKGTPPPPRLPRSGGADGGANKYANLNSFKELLALGHAAVQECYEKYPETYMRLKASQAKGLEAPARTIFGPTPNRSN